MGEAITISAKKDFIRWFLSNFQLKKNEGTWLFNYLLSDDRLLEKVHFTDDLRNREKTMIISTVCSHATPFQFQKKSRVYYDVEHAFHDLKENPNEDIYISLFFKDRLSCPQYLIVLEGMRNMEGHRVSQGTVAGLIAEIVIEKAVRRNRMQQLINEIDQALVCRDKEQFYRLTAELSELKKWEVES